MTQIMASPAPRAGPTALLRRRTDRPEDRVASYYRSPDVRARILEYCGGSPEMPERWSAWQIAAYGGERRLMLPDGAPVPVAPEEITRLLSEGADICRSLADREGALLQVDIDYTNPLEPAEPYLRPDAVFHRLEPIYQAVRKEFLAFGVQPLAVMTARGYHVSARAREGSLFHRTLIEIGSIGASLSARYASRPEGAEALRAGRAHEGACRLVEYLAHRVLRRLAGRTEIPVFLADVPSQEGGAFVCLDLSAYGDPLFDRFSRCAFSSNQKALVSGLAPERPFTLCVPRNRLPLSLLLAARQDVERAARLAGRVTTRIPDLPGNDLRWVERYRRSRLARFHKQYDRGWHDEPSIWPATYDQLDLGALPACVRLPLQDPNPSLLRPVYLRTVALALWSLGWHPRSIAGLIRSKFERDYGWGDYWYRYDAATRADFYVRLFCGAVAAGLDDASRFTCTSQQLRGVCPMAECEFDLARLGAALWRSLRRRSR